MRKSEGHPGDEAWLDLARHTASAEDAASLERHLQDCEKCRNIYETWIAAVGTAAQDAENEPPVDALRAVKAAFSLRRKLPLLERLAIAAGVIYDSMREPVPAGLRGAGTAARLLFHEAEGFAVDLRLEQESDGKEWITGQILKKGGPPDSAGGTAVMLVDRDNRPLAQTIADRMGEFQVEIPSQRFWKAYLETPDGTLVGITVSNKNDLSENESNMS